MGEKTLKHPKLGYEYYCPYIDLLPPLSSEEYNELREDIKKNGMKVPILISQNDNILDGHHRWKIAIELDLPREQIWMHTLSEDLTEEQERELALSLNIHRRQLSREEKRALIESMLKADPGKSDRAIAEKTKASDKTVGAVREKLESTAEIPQLKERQGSDGKKRKVNSKKPKADTKPRTVKAIAVEQEPASENTGNGKKFADWKGRLAFMSKSLLDYSQRLSLLAEVKARERADHCWDVRHILKKMKQDVKHIEEFLDLEEGRETES